MEQERIYQEEQGVSLGEVFGVMFGRKLLLLIITAALSLVSALAIIWYNGRTSTYVGLYDYYVSGLGNGTYIDGSRFDVRDLVTQAKLEQYKTEHEELKNLNMAEVYRNGVIKSIKYETLYKENPAKLNENDDDYVVDKKGYQIILQKKALTFEEAQVLTEAIAKEANIISQKIVANADYSQYLTLYNQSTIYENQIQYLEQQYHLIESKYDNLIAQYGDIVVENSMRLSDIKLQLREYFQNVSFASLKNELSYNGYVKDYTDYEMQIKKQIESLNREKVVNTNKKNELIAQRDALLNAAGSLYSVELTSYNDQIISLTNRIFDIDEEVDLLNIKLNNKTREDTDPEYAAELTEFKEKLQEHFETLVEMTENYTEIEKKVVKEYSIVYFDSNSIVEKENGISVVKFLIIAVIASFVVGVIVNLCLDGKKLTKKYKEEQEKLNNQAA